MESRKLVRFPLYGSKLGYIITDCDFFILCPLLLLSELLNELGGHKNSIAFVSITV